MKPPSISQEKFSILTIYMQFNHEQLIPEENYDRQ